VHTNKLDKLETQGQLEFEHKYYVRMYCDLHHPMDERNERNTTIRLKNKIKFSLDYKGLQPGMAAQPIGPNEQKINQKMTVACSYRDGQPSSEVSADNNYKESLGLGTRLLHGALCESVALSPYSSTGFVPQCVFTII